MDKSVVITDFLQYNNRRRLGANAIALFILLIEKWFENNEKQFYYSDTEACRVLLVKRNTVKAYRESLRNVGIFSFDAKKGRACLYRFNEGYTLLNQAEDKTSKRRDVGQPKELNIPAINKSRTTPTVTDVDGAKNKKEKVALPSTPLPHTIAPIRDIKIPELSEVIEFTKTFKDYRPELNEIIQRKYEMWVKNGWRNGNGRPISSWQGLVKGSWVYWTEATPVENLVDLSKIPNRRRPKITFNED